MASSINQEQKVNKNKEGFLFIFTPFKIFLIQCRNREEIVRNVKMVT